MPSAKKEQVGVISRIMSTIFGWFRDPEPKSGPEEKKIAEDLSVTLEDELKRSNYYGSRTKSVQFTRLFLKEKSEVLEELYAADEKYKIKVEYNQTINDQTDPFAVYKHVQARLKYIEAHPQYGQALNKIVREYSNDLETLNNTVMPSRTTQNAESYVSDSAPKKTKRADTSADEQNSNLECDEMAFPENNSEKVSHSGTDSESATPSIVAPFVALIITAGFTVLNLLKMHHEKQGGSTKGTLIRVGIQVLVPSGSATIAVLLGAMTLPVAIFLIVGGILLASATLGLSFYYNKYFVKKKLSQIECFIKKLPIECLSLEQENALLGLTKHSLSSLEGNKEKDIKKPSQKIQKLEFPLLVHLYKMKPILFSTSSAKHTIKEQKILNVIHHNVDELLNHSSLFSLLIKDISYFKEIYECFNAIKTQEQANCNPNIQSLFAQMQPNQIKDRIALYHDLLVQFQKEQDYKDNVWRVMSRSMSLPIRDKKEFEFLHERVIHLAPQLDEDYQELKKIIDLLQVEINQLKFDESKKRVLDIYTAYEALSYREIRDNEYEFVPAFANA